MSSRKLSIVLRAVLAIFIFTVTLFVTSICAAQSEKVLHSFNSTDGDDPEAGLVMDTRGNLYGTTEGGGYYGGGTVFQLSHKVGGGWAETVLHSFNIDPDGSDPHSGVIFDARGNLYGTTFWGGAYSCGTVFQLRQQGVGRWREQVLYSFGSNGPFNDPNGSHPSAGLVLDAAGNLYGTTLGGGSYQRGTVFELSPNADGSWTEKVLYSFNESAPQTELIFDAAGNLYGATVTTVFELLPEPGGGWTEKTLYTFCSLTNCADGIGPLGGLIFDTAGNLYGTTLGGGSYDWGTVFELSPQAGGGWTYKVLHSFNATGGVYPYRGPWGGLILDARGNLYGTTVQGGAYNYGTVFELSPNADGGWTEKVLHSFDPKCHNDGYNPRAGLIMDVAGNLYGTTSEVGAYYHGSGTVFEITP